MDSRRFIRVLIMIAAMLTAVAQAQSQITIPELAASGGGRSAVNPPSGPAPTIKNILQSTDLVVVGTLGEPHSYLSEDQTEVNTDFPVKDATVFYYKYPPANSQKLKNNTQQTLTLTQLGGTILIDGKEFTQREPALPALQPGTKGLFLLQRRGEKYWIAGPSTVLLPFYGAFSITPDDKLMPLMSRSDFAKEYRNLNVSEGLGRMMKILHSQEQGKADSAKPDTTTN